MFFKISGGADDSYAAMSINVPQKILNNLYTAYKEFYDEYYGEEFDDEEENGEDVFINMIQNLFPNPDTFVMPSQKPDTNCGDFTNMFLMSYEGILHAIAEHEYEVYGIEENIDNPNIDSYILIYDMNDTDLPRFPFITDDNNYPIYSVEQYAVAVSLIVVSQTCPAFKHYRYSAHGIF